MSWDWRCRILWLWLHFKQPLNSNKNDIIYARIETNNSNLQLMLINKWLSLYFNYEFRVWLTKYVSFHTFFNDYTRQKRWHFFLLLNESWNRVDSMVFNDESFPAGTALQIEVIEPKKCTQPIKSIWTIRYAPIFLNNVFN